MFGPGAGVTINSLSLRAEEEYAPVAPSGTIRVLCSGDSFTFGVGVADRDTWCSVIHRRDPRFQTINLGHSGWGLDQSFLFYRRLAPQLEHSVHVVAFIADDIRRIGLREYVGYPKPRYRLDETGVILTGVPVPVPSRVRLWHTYNREKFQRLAVVQLGLRLSQRLRPAPMPDPDWTGPREIALRLIEDLHREALRAGRTSVFVMLQDNAVTSEQEDRLRRFFQSELDRRAIHFIDLVSAFDRHSAPERQALLDPGWGHYTARGYALVGDTIHAHLTSLPEVTAALARLPRAR